MAGELKSGQEIQRRRGALSRRVSGRQACTGVLQGAVSHHSNPGDFLRVHSLILGFAVIGLVACGSKGNDDSKEQGPIVVPPTENKLQFASSVHVEQQTAINEALSALHVLPINESDERLMKMMKIPDLQASTLQNWVQARVQYIINEDFDFDAAIYEPSRPDFSFPWANELPDPDNGVATDASNKNTIMSNIGTAVYYFGKKRSTLIGLRIPGIGDVEFTSPRVGLLQIGPALFPDGAILPQNIAVDIFRLGTLFHEARHSDGHGKTLGFMHAECPKGHDLEGQRACDFSSNGPYTVGALITRDLGKACSQCETRKKVALEGIAAENLTRVIDGWVTISSHSPPSYRAKPVDWDDEPEGHR